MSDGAASAQYPTSSNTLLGFDIDSPRKTITWRIHNKERHGLTHFKLGNFYVDLICNQRHSDKAPCRVHVASGGHFTLKLVGHGETVEKQIALESMH